MKAVKIIAYLLACMLVPFFILVFAALLKAGMWWIVALIAAWVYASMWLNYRFEITDTFSPDERRIFDRVFWLGSP